MPIKTIYECDFCKEDRPKENICVMPNSDKYHLVICHSCISNVRSGYKLYHPKDILLAKDK